MTYKKSTGKKRREVPDSKLVCCICGGGGQLWNVMLKNEDTGCFSYDKACGACRKKAMDNKEAV